MLSVREVNKTLPHLRRALPRRQPQRGAARRRRQHRADHGQPPGEPLPGQPDRLPGRGGGLSRAAHLERRRDLHLHLRQRRDGRRQAALGPAAALRRAARPLPPRPRRDPARSLARRRQASRAGCCTSLLPGSSPGTRAAASVPRGAGLRGLFGVASNFERLRTCVQSFPDVSAPIEPWSGQGVPRFGACPGDLGHPALLHRRLSRGTGGLLRGADPVHRPLPRSS